MSYFIKVKDFRIDVHEIVRYSVSNDEISIHTKNGDLFIWFIDGNNIANEIDKVLLKFTGIGDK